MDDTSLWVSPVVLVSGVGLLIMSTSARYGQMHAELRELMRDLNAGSFVGAPGAEMHEHLRTRTRLLLSALFGLYQSVGFLITGSLVGVLSALWSYSDVPVMVLTCALLFFALMQHFTVNDYALRSHHKVLYDRFGRWTLALAVVGGCLVGSLYMVDEASIAVLWAFLAGGLILNVIKDELPHDRQTSLASFLIGMGGFSVVLVMVAH